MADNRGVSVGVATVFGVAPGGAFSSDFAFDFGDGQTGQSAGVSNVLGVSIALSYGTSSGIAVVDGQSLPTVTIHSGNGLAVGVAVANSVPHVFGISNGVATVNAAVVSRSIGNAVGISGVFSLPTPTGGPFSTEFSLEFGDGLPIGQAAGAAVVLGTAHGISTGFSVGTSAVIGNIISSSIGSATGDSVVTGSNEGTVINAGRGDAVGTSTAQAGVVRRGTGAATGAATVLAQVGSNSRGLSAGVATALAAGRFFARGRASGISVANAQIVYQGIGVAAGTSVVLDDPFNPAQFIGPSPGQTKVDYQFKVLSAQFGSGYAQFALDGLIWNVENRVVTLNWDLITREELDFLINFFDEVCVGGLRPFAWKVPSERGDFFYLFKQDWVTQPNMTVTPLGGRMYSFKTIVRQVRDITTDYGSLYA